MDRVVRWVDLDDGRSGDGAHVTRLRPTGMVVFATVDGPVRRRHAAWATAPGGRAAPPPVAPRMWLRRAACWLLGR